MHTETALSISISTLSLIRGVKKNLYLCKGEGKISTLIRKFPRSPGWGLDEAQALAAELGLGVL